MDHGALRVNICIITLVTTCDFYIIVYFLCFTAAKVTLTSGATSVSAACKKRKLNGEEEFSITVNKNI